MVAQVDASGAASQVILAVASLEAKNSASALTARDPYGFGKQVRWYCYVLICVFLWQVCILQYLCGNETFPFTYLSICTGDTINAHTNIENNVVFTTNHRYHMTVTGKPSCSHRFDCQAARWRCPPYCTCSCSRPQWRADSMARRQKCRPAGAWRHWVLGICWQVKAWNYSYMYNCVHARVMLHYPSCPLTLHLYRCFLCPKNKPKIISYTTLHGAVW